MVSGGSARNGFEQSARHAFDQRSRPFHHAGRPLQRHRYPHCRTGKPQKIPVTYDVPKTVSNVIASIDGQSQFTDPGLILQGVSDANGQASWPFTLNLSETAGFATAITGLHVGSQDLSSQIPTLFPGGVLLPAQSVTGSLTVTGVPLGEQLPVQIQGKDVLSGAQWSISGHILFSPTVFPSSLLVSQFPRTVRENPANPGCPFVQHLVVESRGQVDTNLDGLLQTTGFLLPGTTTQEMFGTNYLPAGGAVESDVCWANQPDFTLITFAQSVSYNYPVSFTSTAPRFTPR